MGVLVERKSKSDQPVEGSDIINTCTADKRHATLLTDNTVGTVGHIDSSGGDCPGKNELHGDVIAR